MRVVMAALVYFLIVFGAGFIFGVFRELVLTPAYGRTTAILLETPFMLIAIVAGAWIAIHHKCSGLNKSALLMVGLISFLLMQVADFGVGLGLRGMNVQDQLIYLKTSAGRLYLGLLTVFTVMPMVVGTFVPAGKVPPPQRPPPGARER